jgi:transcriptional regulator with XRE-family HTH domain
VTPEELKERRKALKLSQAALAEKLQVSANTIHRWESGEMWPPANEAMLDLALAALENRYGINRDYKVHLFGSPTDEVAVQALGVEAAALEFVMKTFAPITDSVQCVVTTPDGKIAGEITITRQQVSDCIERMSRARESPQQY